MLRMRFLAALIVLMTVMGTASPVSASHGWRTYDTYDLIGTHWALSVADAVTNSGEGTENWKDFRMSETSSAALIDKVCRAQAYWNGNTPHGGTLYSVYSSKQSGCSFFGKIHDAPNSWDATYPDDIYFGFWWFSDATGGRWLELDVKRH